jgi:hypothetical protein
MQHQLRRRRRHPRGTTRPTHSLATLLTARRCAAQVVRTHFAPQRAGAVARVRERVAEALPLLNHGRRVGDEDGGRAGGEVRGILVFVEALD